MSGNDRFVDAVTRLVRRFARSAGGNVGTLGALLLVPMIATIGLAVEGGGWLVSQRSMQHAADSAAIAAATNNSASFVAEARAVSAEYGFSHGTGAVTVDVIDNAACPAPSTDTNCYQVTVTRPQRLYLLGIVRFAGDTTLDGGPAQTVVARAVARRPGRAATYCMVGLSSSGQAIRVNGGPNVDLAGCDMFSNSNLVCNGANADTGVYYGDSVGTSSCGDVERPGQTLLPDPFSYLSANPPIPANSCSSYPQGAAGPTISSATSFASAVSRCGDTRLTSNVTVTAANSVLVVYNGRLDLNGFTLKTSGSGSLTLIFSGTNQSGGPTTYNHIPVNTTGTGVLDIAAPTTGALKGVAMMQDGRLTGSKNNLNLLYTGNDPTLMIQGLIYMPNGEFDIRGAINLKSGGLSCLGIVAKTVLVSGTGSVFDNASSQCVQAGLDLPDIPGTEQRLGLVQ